MTIFLLVPLLIKKKNSNGGLFHIQGFLAKDLQAEALGKLDHRVKVAAEQFMKILEQIDAMVINLRSSVSS